MSASFVFRKSANSQFFFNLQAENNETILTSEQYSAKQSAQDGIESVRKNAPLEGRYERKTSTDGKPFFVLKAANGETIGKSELYSSSAAMENGIEAVKRTAPGASVVDQT